MRWVTYTVDFFTINNEEIVEAKPGWDGFYYSALVVMVMTMEGMVIVEEVEDYQVSRKKCHDCIILTCR